VPVPLETYVDSDDISATMPSIFPALIKPAQGDSSIGITQNAVVRNAGQLVNYLDFLSSTMPGVPVLIQEFLSGREFSVGLVGNPGKFEALPVLEVDYSKYDRYGRVLGIVLVNGEDANLEQVEAAVPTDWRLDVFRREIPGEHFEELTEGTRYLVEARDSVTSAPELARLTLNVAKAHTDAASSPYSKRLVYGGYTISMASAQIVRALPNLVTLIGWRSCDHTRPVFEGDILHTEFTIDAKHSLQNGGGLVDLHALVHATRADQAAEPGADAPVLDWRAIGLMA